jgi:hypothetical protein
MEAICASRQQVRLSSVAEKKRFTDFRDGTASGVGREEGLGIGSRLVGVSFGEEHFAARQPQVLRLRLSRARGFAQDDNC